MSARKIFHKSSINTDETCKMFGIFLQDRPDPHGFPRGIPWIRTGLPWVPTRLPPCFPHRYPLWDPFRGIASVASSAQYHMILHRSPAKCRNVTYCPPSNPTLPFLPCVALLHCWREASGRLLQQAQHDTFGAFLFRDQGLLLIFSVLTTHHVYCRFQEKSLLLCSPSDNIA